MKSKPIKNLSLVLYGIMAFPLAFAGIPIYINAPEFYASNFGISLGLIGFSLLLLRAFDAIQDPFIGYLSDKYSSYKNIIFSLGILFLGIGFFMLFNPKETATIYWFSFSVLIATTGYSIIAINLNALGGIWSEDKDTKTLISSFRESFGLLGLIFAAILPSILFRLYSSEDAYSAYSIIMITILSISSFLFLKFWLPKFPVETKSNINFKFNNFIEAIKSKRYFFSIYFVSMLSSSIPAVLIIFFVNDVLMLEKYFGLFLLSYFLAGAISVFMWNFISKKFGKMNAWAASMILAVITFIWAFSVSEGDFIPYLIICILSGVAFGAELCLPPSILADKTSAKNNNSDYSILAFLAKAALAISSGICLPLLDYFGYSVISDNNQNSLSALSFLYALLPCLIKIISALMLIKIIKKGEAYENKITNTNNGGNNA